MFVVGSVVGSVLHNKHVSFHQGISEALQHNGVIHLHLHILPFVSLQKLLLLRFGYCNVDYI